MLLCGGDLSPFIPSPESPVPAPSGSPVRLPPHDLLRELHVVGGDGIEGVEGARLGVTRRLGHHGGRMAITTQRIHAALHEEHRANLAVAGLDLDGHVAAARQGAGVEELSVHHRDPPAKMVIMATGATLAPACRETGGVGAGEAGTTR